MKQLGTHERLQSVIAVLSVINELDKIMTMEEQKART
jgi:hypothetical protein